MTQASSRPHDTQALDALTGGAFSAPTSGERTSRVRDWLASNPSQEQMQEVFKELSARDKGAAKLLREKLDEIKRSKGQEAIALEWTNKAQALLDGAKLNIADALAWQRDAAKAGAPLSKEPLAALKGLLAQRVKGIEDLQHRVQVQREAAVLLAQRIEVLSTKSWRDAQAVMQSIQQDVAHWQTQANDIVGDGNWSSVDLKFVPLLDASRNQLVLVWEAFSSALQQTLAASENPAEALPPVPVWADELRLARGLPLTPSPSPAPSKVDPELRERATQVVSEVLRTLEQEISEGHGKASAGAANALRNALKEFGALIEGKLDKQAHAALAAAGELEGWQRWRADQLREELVLKAEALLQRPEGQALGGRKMQDSLRTLREQWKQIDKGGVANHGLWKRFDDACNAAYKVVAAWLDKVKTEAVEHRLQRLAMIEEVKAWAAANTTALDDDWKGFNRILHQFSERWREAGHLSEKAFAELQPLWQDAMAQAAGPLEALQQRSLALRQTMIEESAQLGAMSVLRIDAVKALQTRWQAEAHAVPLERRLEQKLWDAFRKPIDQAFDRKTAEREKATADLSERDRLVLEASKALEVANATGDAAQIRHAMNALDAALRGQAQAQVVAQAAVEAAVEASVQLEGVAVADVEAVAVVAPKAPPKPVIAMRGDDRPGMKKTEPVVPGRGGKFGDRRDERSRRDSRDTHSTQRGAERVPLERAAWQEAPRLGDVAFRAQREALEHAQLALKKLEAQAHGEALTQLLGAWEKRDASLMPTAQEFDNRIARTASSSWGQALSSAAGAQAGEALLRLEMASELPTPAELLNDRRALQLQMLTRRNDPSPAQTWTQDVAKVLASEFEARSERRLKNVLRVLLKR
ncbi:MAG: DUF349 domain-containing protein [Burkholderiaceae bacterium]